MKIICIGTLDKFSRFYLDIKHQLKTQAKTNVKIKIYTLHLSGFLYTFLRLASCSWISLKVWISANRKSKYYTSIINETDIYKGIHFNDYINFHLKLNKNIPKQSLQIQALAYIDFFDENFKKEQPDFLITIGDSRMSIEIAVAIAKRKGIKVYYIEQGPFNTTFFDDEGVNANLSIRNRSFNDVELNKDIKFNTTSKKYNRSPIYRGLDMLFMTFQKSYIYPPDLKFTDLNSYRPKKVETKINLQNKNKSNILLILQVPFDVNMIKHSPLFKTHAEIIKTIYQNLPENAELIIREHPLYINKYEKEVYNFIAENNIKIENNYSLNDALMLADVVVVNNSTVGLEAIFNYKTLVVLGNAFYDNEQICLKLKHKSELQTILKKSLDHSPDKIQIDNFKQLLLNTVMLEGSITDKHLKSSQLIANHLLAHN